MLPLLLDWLFPPRCAACALEVGPRRAFCPACAATVERAPAQRGRVGAAFWFGGALSTAVHRWKFQDALGVGAAVCALFASELAAWLPAGAVLVPVPAHPLRLAERGFNPPGLLAHALAAHTGAPVAHLLRRQRDTAQQSRLARAERQVNLAAAFTAVGAPPAGRVPVLVDDVLTTGATVRACWAALGQPGPVRAAVLARAPEPTSGKMRS